MLKFIEKQFESQDIIIPLYDKKLSTIFQAKCFTIHAK
jgi:hypothetical protein